MALAGVVLTPVLAQTDSRAAEIASQQEEKAAQARPDERNKVERAMLWFREQDPLQRFSTGFAGFRPKIGGLGPGTGFGIGPEYSRTGLLDGLVNFRTAAQVSFRGDRKFDLQLSAPRIGKGRYFAEFYAVHHDYPRLSYYGSGPDSQKSGRTDFRLEDTAFDSTFGVRPLKHLTVGTSAGYVFNNVGRGTDSRYASAETVYSPAQAPGIDVQSNFLRAGTFAQYDWRDNPDGPRRGGNYFVQFNDYRDRSFGLGNFRRLDMEAQQFVPVLNDRRVFAFRAKSALTYSDGGRSIPFYMQPSLGGGEDLRGYRALPVPGRQPGGHECRIPLGSLQRLGYGGLRGRRPACSTASRTSALRSMETDLGFGFRFNQRNKTFLRLDVGFSHEGFQVWVKFANVFKKGPVHTSSNMGDF